MKRYCRRSTGKTTKSRSRCTVDKIWHRIWKLEEEQQAVAQGDAAMAADTVFHSDGEFDSMGLETHTDCKGLPIELEKVLHSPSNKPVVEGSPETTSLKTADVNTSKSYWFILLLQEIW
jgi:hypothetical protein